MFGSTSLYWNHKDGSVSKTRSWLLINKGDSHRLLACLSLLPHRIYKIDPIRSHVREKQYEGGILRIKIGQK